MKRMRMVLIMLLGVVVPLACTVPASAARYQCGNQCNGKSPNWAIPSNGVKCSSSARKIADGYPKVSDGSGKYLGYVDKNFHIKVYYSSVCQTMWGTVTAYTTRNAMCYLSVQQLYVGYSSGPASLRNCPKSGNTFTTPMVNDHSSNYKAAAQVSFSENFRTGGNYGDYRGGDFYKVY